MVSRYTFVKSAAKLQKKTDMSKSFDEKEVRFKYVDFRDWHYMDSFVLDYRAFSEYKKRMFPKWFLDSGLWSLYNLDQIIFYSSFRTLCISVDKYRKVFVRRIDYPLMSKLEFQIIFYNEAR